MAENSLCMIEMKLKIYQNKNNEIEKRIDTSYRKK